MNRSTRIDYAAVNAKGVVLYTFNDAAKARAWVRNSAALHDGLHVREITVTTQSRKIYSPPKSRSDDLAIPPAPRVAPPARAIEAARSDEREIAA
jgi:hypothetical protein